MNEWIYIIHILHVAYKHFFEVYHLNANSTLMPHLIWWMLLQNKFFIKQTLKKIYMCPCVSLLWFLECNWSDEVQEMVQSLQTNCPWVSHLGIWHLNHNLFSRVSFIFFCQKRWRNIFKVFYICLLSRWTPLGTSETHSSLPFQALSSLAAEADRPGCKE